jgi:hypothetical protein
MTRYPQRCIVSVPPTLGWNAEAGNALETWNVFPHSPGLCPTVYNTWKQPGVKRASRALGCTLKFKSRMWKVEKENMAKKGRGKKWGNRKKKEK